MAARTSDGVAARPLGSGTDHGQSGAMTTYQTMPFHLETERLILRPWDEADAAAFCELLAERGEGTPEVEHIRKSVAELLAATETTGIALLPIQRRDEGDFIGYCGLIIGRSTLEEPEIAYELFQHAHGRGYATEAARAVLEAAAATGRERSGRPSVRGTRPRSVSWRRSGSSGTTSPRRTTAKWSGSRVRCRDARARARGLPGEAGPGQPVFGSRWQYDHRPAAVRSTV